MRHLILSDMHGNHEAFQAVLRHTRPETFDRVLVLGDLVGYGAAPNEVVEAVRGMTNLTLVRGNHDKVVAGIDEGENFNQVALAAARWSARALRDENLAYVADLPQGPCDVAPGLAICHGSPIDEDTYVFSDYDAFEIFSAYDRPLTFFGHTHVPSVFSVDQQGIEVRALRGEGSLRLERGTRYLINPGSIGQPRDRDPRAAFMTYDDAEQLVSWHRLAYPIAAAQRRILDAGLPPVLAERLAVGV